MSGHNKWSKIKHKKAAGDAAKSKIFSKLSRLITAESKLCAGDTSSPALRTAIEKAKSINMPNETIDRAVKKGTAADAASMESVMYEAYGPGGIAILITGLTDNKNRTAAEVKHILSKNGCSLAAPGAASWAFTKEGTEWKPNSPAELSDEDIPKMERLVGELEENEDVQDVFPNAD